MTTMIERANLCDDETSSEPFSAQIGSSQQASLASPICRTTKGMQAEEEESEFVRKERLAIRELESILPEGHDDRRERIGE